MWRQSTENFLQEMDSQIRAKISIQGSEPDQNYTPVGEEVLAFSIPCSFSQLNSAHWINVQLLRQTPIFHNHLITKNSPHNARGWHQPRGTSEWGTCLNNVVKCPNCFIRQQSKVWKCDKVTDYFDPSMTVKNTQWHYQGHAYEVVAEAY